MSLPESGRSKVAKGSGGSGGKLLVEQYRSGISCQAKHRRTLVALGLRKIRQRVELPDNPAVRGMVKSIMHLVRIVEGK